MPDTNERYEMNETKPIIIAIDGPAGAGKSTVAARLARRFHLLNLETGAMYRAFALKALEANISPEDAEALERLAATTSIRLEESEHGNRVFLDGFEVTSRLRDTPVTEAASRVSVHPAIRKWMVDLQRKLGESSRIVMEGRDIGTAVFPEAEVKIFLDADPMVRSQRRYEQIEAAPKAATVAPESVLEELRERDQRDRTRALSPLKPAPDAVVIDSTNLTLDEVVGRAEAIVIDRLNGSV
jgi:CMP/dCMP kinase